MVPAAPSCALFWHLLTRYWCLVWLSLTGRAQHGQVCPETQASDPGTFPVFFLMKQLSVFYTPGICSPWNWPHQTMASYVAGSGVPPHVNLTHCPKGVGWRMKIGVRESTFSLSSSFCGAICCNWTGHQETWNLCFFHLSTGQSFLPFFSHLALKRNDTIEFRPHKLLTPTGFIDLEVWKSISELLREMWFIQDVILMTKFVMAQSGVLSKVNRTGKI